MNDGKQTDISLNKQEEIERLLLIFGKSKVASAKATFRFLLNENICSPSRQANFEPLRPPEKFQRKHRGVSEKRIDMSLHHPLPECPVKSALQGTDEYYDIVLLRLMESTF